MSKSRNGFSLIELLIVIVIILVIAAIAIPNLLRSRIAANEASAVGSLRSITTVSVAYAALYGNGFPPSLGTLGGPAAATTPTCDNALLLDSVLSNNGSGNTSSKSGYNFKYSPGVANPTAAANCTNPGVNTFSLVATPVTIGSTGQRGFFVDQTGVMRFTVDGTAPTNSDAALQ